MRKGYFFKYGRFEKKYRFNVKKMFRLNKGKNTKKYEKATWRNTTLHREVLPRRNTKVLFSMCGVLFVMWIGLLLFSTYFRIQALSVEGLERVARNEVDGVLKEYFSGKHFGLFHRDNYFLVREDTAERVLKSAFPFEHVVLKKSFPHAATIIIKEKRHTGVRGDTEGYFLVDPQGTAIEKIKDRRENEFLEIVRGEVTTTIAFPDTAEIFKQVGEVPIIMLSEDQTAALYEKIMRAVQMAYGNLNSIVGKGSSVHHFVLEEENKSFIDVFMVGPRNLVWVVKFSAESNGKDMWSAMRRLWDKIPPERRNRLEYIDMRFLPRAYYK